MNKCPACGGTKEQPDPFGCEAAFHGEINPAIKPYYVSPFSSIVGCGIFHRNNNMQPVALIPAQAPAGITFTSVVEARKSKIVKEETERIALIICKALNS